MLVNELHKDLISFLLLRLSGPVRVLERHFIYFLVEWGPLSSSIANALLEFLLLLVHLLLVSQRIFVEHFVFPLSLPQLISKLVVRRNFIKD